MRRLPRLIDMQVHAGSAGLELEEQRVISLALFTVFEPIRLWLREHDIRAPFRKLLVTLADQDVFAKWHGQVVNVGGVCEVTEAVSVASLKQNATDHTWVLGYVEHALQAVSNDLGWSSDELWEHVRSLGKLPLPLVHFFDSMACVDPASGRRCVPWLSVRPDETLVGVRIGVRDVTLASARGPLYVEVKLPFVRAELRGGAYRLLDRSGDVLASVSMDDEPM